MCVGLFSIDIKSMYVLAYFLLSYYSLVNVSTHVVSVYSQLAGFVCLNL